MTTFAENRQAMEDRLDNLLLDADSYLSELVESSDENFGSVPFSVDRILPNDYVFLAPNPPSSEVQLPDTPASPSVSVSTGSVPTDTGIEFSEIPDIEVSDLDASPPTWQAIPAPSGGALPAAPTDAPSFVSPDIPAAPSVDLPAVPTFEALSLPAAPSIDLPSFVSALPDDDLVAPTAEFRYAEAVYDSTLLDPLKAKLLYDLQNGGYGIDTTDEVALFNRARDREVEAMLSKIEDAGRAMAMRGFPLPPGELSIHVDRAYQDMQDKVSSVSRDITLERSKLFVENRQFTIREVKEVEQILIGFHNSVQERALNVARATVEMSVAIFEALVGRYNARLNAYRSESEAFANRIRGELAKAEIYRTEVEAKNVEAQMQKMLVDRYLAQLKGIEIGVDIFRVKMDAAKVQADMERTKLEAFRLRVDTYSAQVQAKTAEFGLYRAQVEGQKAQVDVFEAQVRAHTSTIAGLKAKSDIHLARVQIESEQARSKLAKFQAELTQYETEARVNLAEAGFDVDIFRAETDAYRARVDARTREAELEQKAFATMQTHDDTLERIRVENARVKLEAAVKATEFRVAASKFGSEKFFALLTSMANSVNSLAVETSEAA